MTQRSRAYPGFPLEECIKRLRKIKAELGVGPHDRATLSGALEMAEGTAIRPVAALVHFGLLHNSVDGYSITKLGRIVADPLENELGDALLRCMRSPALYAELIARLEGDGRIPAQLATLLHRQFQITDKAARLAAQTFVRSAKFAGLVDEELRFVKSGDQAYTNQTDHHDDTHVHVSGDVAVSNSAAGTLHVKLDEQEFRFCLTGGKFAHLAVPADLTHRDIKIIKKQLELLEMQICDD